MLEFLQETWENMVKLDKFDEVADGITAGLSNLNKWYRKTDDTDAYFISLGMFGLLYIQPNLVICLSPRP